MSTIEKLEIPRLVALLFCDYANRTADGKHNLMGVFESIVVDPEEKEEPSFFLYIKTSGTTKGSMHISILNPEGNRNGDLFYDIKPEDNSLDTPFYAQLLTIMQFSLEVEGDYWFDVIYEGKSLGGTALTIKFAKQEEQ